MIEDIRYSKKINWPVLIFFIAVMVALLIYFDRAIADQQPEAVIIAQKTMTAMGGMNNWKAIHAIRFNFVVEPKGASAEAAKHLWDRTNNRDHVEGATKGGKQMVAWIDLTTKSGAAWLDGKKLDGKELTDAMDWAYNGWVNDTYWFAMPWKLLDQGVNLKYEGKKDGRDVLHLSFNKVGLTPGDQYWVSINKDTGLVDRWSFLLEGDKEKGTFDWKDWNDYGKVKISINKPSTAGDVTIRFDPMQVLDSADPSYFSSDLKKLD